LAEADLEITKTVDNPTPAAGNPVEYIITVTNLGPDAASDVVVTDLLPDTLAIPDGLAVFTSQGSYESQTGLWSAGDLAVDDTATLLIPAILKDGVQASCIVNVAATTDSSETDSNPDNDQAANAFHLGTVGACNDLRLSATVSFGPAYTCLGTQTVKFDITIENPGPDSATDIDLNLALSEETYTQGATEVCSETNCQLGELHAGESLTVTVTAEFDRAVMLEYQFRADGLEADGNLANNTVTGRINVPAVSKDDCQLDLDFSDIDLGDGPGMMGVPDCFIASAAFGSYLDPHVTVLREFRDDHLLTNSIGTALVQFYYRTSPPIAAFIEQHEELRSVVRWSLTPLVYAIAYPWKVMSTLFVLLCGFLRRKALARWLRGRSGPTW
jgi:uncharacterized repeat protein (TIGR01451 family)